MADASFVYCTLRFAASILSLIICLGISFPRVAFFSFIYSRLSWQEENEELLRVLTSLCYLMFGVCCVSRDECQGCSAGYSVGYSAGKCLVVPLVKSIFIRDTTHPWERTRDEREKERRTSYMRYQHTESTRLYTLRKVWYAMRDAERNKAIRITNVLSFTSHNSSGEHLLSLPIITFASQSGKKKVLCFSSSLPPFDTCILGTFSVHRIPLDSCVYVAVSELRRLSHLVLFEKSFSSLFFDHRFCRCFGRPCVHTLSLSCLFLTSIRLSIEALN